MPSRSEQPPIDSPSVVVQGHPKYNEDLETTEHVVHIKEHKVAALVSRAKSPPRIPDGKVPLDKEQQRKAFIHEICGCLNVNNDQLREIMAQLLKSMEQGLSHDWKNSAVKMLPSFVRSVPNGTERGDFLALDLGGTNFRVLLIRLTGDNTEAQIVSKIFRVPHELMVGSGEALFDHIAECMSKFSKENHMDTTKTLPLGFTFSFPCDQLGLTSAKLMTWTKGFKASGVEGEDVVTLLRKSVKKRKDVDIDIVALLNDTTGTLMACAYNENSCQVGVIIGTGTNACYMEKLNRCPKLVGIIDPNDGGPDEIIINTEWGAFGNDGGLDQIRTSFDREIDRTSINPNKQIFEKMISGMYMGELVRLVLEKLTKADLLFDGKGSDELYTRGQFPTKFVSEIERDLMEDRTFPTTRQILQDIGLDHITLADCANVAYVCSLVSTRAAHLCAAGIATLLNRMQKPKVTVGVDGSVYRFHPTFKQLLDDKLDQLITKGLKFKLMLSEDGSGKGAALVAAVVAQRVNGEKLAQQKLN